MTEVIGFVISNYTWFLVGSIIILLAIIGSYADKTNFGQGKANDSTTEGSKIIEQNSNILSNDEINKKFAINLSNNAADNIISQNITDSNINNSVAQNSLQSANVVHPGNNDSINNLKTEMNDQNLIDKKNEDNNILEQSTLENTILNIYETEIDSKLDNKEINELSLDISEKDTNQNLNVNSEELFNEFDKEFNAIVPKKEIINGDLLDDINSLSLDKKQEFSFNSIPDLDNVDLPKISELEKEDNIWKF